MEGSQAARAEDGSREQNEEYPDRLDEELYDVGRCESPHPAEHRIADHHETAEQYRESTVEPGHRLGDTADCDDRYDDDHEVVASHHDAAGNPRRGAEAPRQ